MYNSAAYARATARNIAANRAKGAAARMTAWVVADATRADLVKFVDAKAASGRSNFFNSIANAMITYGGLTAGQEAAVRKIMAQEANPVAPVATAQIGDMAGLYAIFQAAQRKLKRPAIVVETPVGEIKLSVAGQNARYPGSVNVAEKGAFGEAKFYGRIMQDGGFVQGREAAPEALVSYLVDFAANPAKMAAAHGHRTGNCCFCNRPLTDERSTSVGYGPICAGHYNLPWGEVAAIAA
jgi:hypothetical protein